MTLIKNQIINALTGKGFEKNHYLEAFDKQLCRVYFDDNVLVFITFDKKLDGMIDCTARLPTNLPPEKLMKVIDSLMA